MKNLTPIPPQNTAPATIIAADAPLPEAVKTALHGALAAFAYSANIPVEDRVANRQAYKLAMKGFHEKLVVSALEHLTVHNPRNPFPFTPQDLFERLKFERRAWVLHVKAALLAPSTRADLYFHGAGQKHPDFGGAPLTLKCTMPDDFILDVLAEIAVFGLDPFVKASREALDAIPRSALPEATWTEIASQRTALEEERAFLQNRMEQAQKAREEAAKRHAATQKAADENSLANSRLGIQAPKRPS